MSKTFKPLLFLISIFCTLCIEEKFLQRKENFKPFISVPSMDSLKKIVHEMEEEEDDELRSFALSAGLKNLKVKCLYLNEYSIYDISRLGANVMDKDKKVHTYTIEHGSSKYTIYYNFCYDLKDVEGCNCEKKKQAFYKKDDGNCQPLSGAIGLGNTWEKESNNSENKEVLRITVNQNDDEKTKHTFIYRLECNKEGEDKKFDVIKEKTTITEESGVLNVTLYIRSKEACEKADFYFIVKFIQDYKAIFIIALMGFGLFNCIFGKKLAKYTGFLLSLLIITVLVLVFSQFVLPSGCKEWIIWVMLAVGILLGGTAGYFVFKYHEKAFALVAGGIAGFFIGEFLYNLFGNRIDANGTVINIVFVVASIIALVVLAYFFNKFIIIFSTSFIGSYCFIRGISLFAGKFPDEFQVMDLTTEGETEQLKELLTWEVYVYLAAMLVLCVISIVLQFKFNKDDDDDKDTEGAPDKNLRSAE